MNPAKKALLGIYAQLDKYHPKISPHCLWNGCEAKPISSHSHSEKFLRNISENNLIYGLNESFIARQKGTLFKKFGVCQASTFYGFCANHDCSLFKKIENASIINVDTETAFLLLMRSLFLEYYKKIVAIKKIQKLGVLCDNKNIPINHDFLNQYIEGKKQYIEIDFPYYSKIIYPIYQSKNYTNVRYLSCCIEKYIPISISTIICPLFDKFYTDNCEIQPFFSLNVIPYKEKCFIFLSWLSEYNNHMQWINKKFSSDLNKLINYLCFIESEDYFVSPTFYSAVIVKKKYYLTKALHNRSFNPELGFNQTEEICKFT